MFNTIVSYVSVMANKVLLLLLLLLYTCAHTTRENTTLFSTLHGMPARTSDEKGVCPSVRLPVKRVDCDRTEEIAGCLYHTKDHLA